LKISKNAHNGINCSSAVVKVYNVIRYQLSSLPTLQVTPSPVYPSLHLQWNDPSVFVHSAFVAQLSVCSVHSFISEIHQHT